VEVIVTSKPELEQLIETAVRVAVSKITPVHFPLLMNKKQVAEYLGKSISTVNSYMTEGMPYRKEGNEHPEFYKPDVDEWLKCRFLSATKEKESTPKIRTGAKERGTFGAAARAG
jgi:hypothetical protein